MVQIKRIWKYNLLDEQIWDFQKIVKDNSLKGVYKPSNILSGISSFWDKFC